MDSFIFALRDSSVDFVCCDMPDANTLTVGLLTVIAQHERETTSTCDAQLGSPQNFTTDIILGQAAMQRNVYKHQANRQAAHGGTAESQGADLVANCRQA